MTKPALCPLCGTEMLYDPTVSATERGVTHIWNCPLCPGLLLEFYEPGDLTALAMQPLREKPVGKRADRTVGYDIRGDLTLFIERRHFKDQELDFDVGEIPQFFRIIENGVEQRSHGWAQGNRVTQWG